MTPKKILTSINLIYFALILVMAGFAVFVFVWIYTGQEMAPVEAEFESLLRILVIAIVPVGMGIGYVAFKAGLKGVTSDMPLPSKLQRYQNAILIRCAGFEMPGMFASVVAFITGNESFLLFTAVMVVLFLLFRPTVNSISNDLQLSTRESMELEN